MKYRTKPVFIDAWLFDGTNGRELCETQRVLGTIQIAYECVDRGVQCLSIWTDEGRKIAYPGDYIVQSAMGGYVPYKRDRFEVTFEAVE